MRHSRCAEHNLRDVDIPLGVLAVVAGSGKSSLVHGSIPAGADVVSIDQGTRDGGDAVVRGEAGDQTDQESRKRRLPSRS